MTVTDIVTSIVSGELDSDLSKITEAVKSRKNIKLDAKRVMISKGDIVVFNKSARPKYLVGVKATVTKKNPKTVVIDIEQNGKAGRFNGMKQVRTPVSIIDILEV